MTKCMERVFYTSRLEGISMGNSSKVESKGLEFYSYLRIKFTLAIGSNRD